MKKKLIAAGAASLAVAAMPVVGVFAADPVTQPDVIDNITLTVNESCTFSTGGTGVSYTDTINAGASTTFASTDPHAFVVNCNSKNYAVTAQATNLVKAGAAAHGTINYVPNNTYTSTSTAATADDGVWSAFLTDGDTEAVISTTKSTIKSGNATTTDHFSVAYKAYAGRAQEQGTYTGTVTYTLTGTNS